MLKTKNKHYTSLIISFKKYYTLTSHLSKIRITNITMNQQLELTMQLEDLSISEKSTAKKLNLNIFCIHLHLYQQKRSMSIWFKIINLTYYILSTLKQLIYDFLIVSFKIYLK